LLLVRTPHPPRVVEEKSDCLLFVLTVLELNQLQYTGKIGIAIHVGLEEPKDRESRADVEAAERAQQMKVGWFCDPIFGNGDYPESMKAQLAKAAQMLGLERSSLQEFSEEEKRYNRGKLFVYEAIVKMIAN